MTTNILITTTSFPGITPQTSSLGGAPFLLREVKALTRIGYNTTVIMPAIKGTPPLETGKNITVIRVQYPLMQYNPGYQGRPQHGNKSPLAIITQLSMAFFLWLSIGKHIIKQKPHIVWSNWLQVGAITALANICRRPHLTTVRGSDVRESSNLSIHLMAKLCPNLLNMYSEDPEINSWIRKYKFKSYTVPAVYETKQLNKLKTTKTITIIGRYDEEASSLYLKGLGKPLFDVINQLLSIRDDFHVTIIGDGRSLASYQDLLKEHKARTTFTGWQSNFDRELERSYLVVGGSGMNGVIMDAVPNQIPVLISKNLTGTLWKNGVNCLTFDPQNSSQWLATLQQALNNEDRLKELAIQAQKDLSKVAQPEELAGRFWKRALTEFINTKQQLIRGIKK
jgi:glycosyltransferase involved in cell wall biosynthesis